MLEEVKILLGDAAAGYSDALINLVIKQTLAEVAAYCKRDIDTELEMIAQKMIIIKLNRLNTEGLASQGYSGVSESYIDGYPADIMALLNRKRKIKAV